MHSGIRFDSCNFEYVRCRSCGIKFVIGFGTKVNKKRANSGCSFCIINMDLHLSVIGAIVIK